MRNYDYGYVSASEKDNMIGWFVAFVCASIITFLIFTIAYDTSGRQPDDHIGPRPAGVTQLSDRAYLIERDSSVSSEQVCLGSDDQDDSGVNSITLVERLRASYVECEQGQTWNDHRPKSLNWPHSMVRTITTPTFWFVEGILFFLCSIYAMCIFVGYAHENRKARKMAKAERKKKMADAEDARLELAAAFAKGDIEMPEFEAGLNKIYDVAPRRK